VHRSTIAADKPTAPSDSGDKFSQRQRACRDDALHLVRQPFGTVPFRIAAEDNRLNP
jgi:hypothetical protein